MVAANDFGLKPFLIELPYRVVVTYTLAGNPMTTINPPAGVTPELILIGFVATFLTVATVWVLWYAAEKVLPDEVGQLQFFLTFIVVVIPFVMLVYFGLDVLIDDAVATGAGWPTALPFAGWPTEWPLVLPPEILIAAVVYIGLTVWLGLRWRKLGNPSKRDTAMRRGG